MMHPVITFIGFGKKQTKFLSSSQHCYVLAHVFEVNGTEPKSILASITHKRTPCSLLNINTS